MRLPLRLLVAGVAAAGLLTGCGAATATTPAASGHTGHGSTGTELWAVQSGPLGVVATDGEGHLLYRSDADTTTPPTSTCTDTCTDTWVPLLLPDAAPPQLLGVAADKVGELTRPDGGVQVTLDGWPLYYNPADTPGLADTGHNGADDRWFAITPTGTKATP